MAFNKMLLVALCVVALLAVRSESHGLDEFTGGTNEATPAMQTFFKPEAAALPESIDASMPATMAAKPEASAIPTTTDAAATTTTNPTTAASSPAPRSVSVAAGVACGVAAVAVVGIAVAVAYVMRGRRGARRGTEVQLGSSP
ncbi:unnamed protein product [Urochloa decumbens]|uniref:Uncharacterized protein n=1 Tax=Urochloa decumbens TaxID=240449 RepID=A0ABC9F8G1_9POAL